MPRLAPLPVFPPSGPSPNARGVGCWRLHPDGEPWPGLPQAIVAVRHALPERRDLQSLAWLLLPRLPGKPMASDSVKDRDTVTLRMPMEEVIITHGWVALNTGEAANVLWVDVDGPHWRERLARAIDAGLPPPAWISESARGAHLAWILRTPVVLRLADLAADHRRARLLSVTLSYLRTALGADAAASHGGLMKNPWSARWATTVHRLEAVDLRDLLTPLEAQAEAEGWEAPKWTRRAAPDPADSPKGSRLWDGLRFKAYATGESDEATLRGWADELAAELGSPAPPGQRRGMARRVARFMLTRWQGKRRVAPLSPAAVHARQVAAGLATAATRRAGTAERLAEAEAALLARGERATLSAVAAEAGVARSTVQRHRREGGHTLPPLSGSSSILVHLSLPEGAAPLPVVEDAAVLSPPAFQDSPNPVPVIPIPALAPPRLPRCLVRLVGEGNPSSLVRLAGVGDGGPDPRFLSRRDRAALSRYDRESWHREAARAGLRPYALALASRRGRLYAERRAELDDLAATVLHHGDLFRDDDPRGCPIAASAATERLRLAVLGWAARFKAEDRVEVRIMAALAELDGNRAPRLRTAPDSLDLVVRGLPPNPGKAEQESPSVRGREQVQVVQGRMAEAAVQNAMAEAAVGHHQTVPHREPAPLSLMVLPDEAAQTAWERSKRRAA